MGQSKEVQWDSQSHCSLNVKMYIVSLPPNIMGEVTPIPLLCCIYVYINCASSLICTNVHSHLDLATCKYVNIYQQAQLRETVTRDPMVPFYYNPELGFLSRDISRSRTRSCVWRWDPWSLYIFVYIFTHDQPVDCFYPSYPKSQSRCLLSLCIVLLVHAYFYAF